MRHAWIVALTVSVFACGTQGQPNGVESSSQRLDLSRVALFKDGFGFFVGQAGVSEDENGSSFLLPAVPVQGTFWLSYPPDVNLVSVVAEKVRSEGRELEAITIPEILKANVGKRVRITLDEKQVYEFYYDLVNVRGELTLINYKKRAVTVEVTKTLSGEVVSTEPEAKVEKLVAGPQRLNGLRKLTWTVEIAPGQARELMYTYEVYLRGERIPGAMRSFQGSAPEPGTP